MALQTDTEDMYRAAAALHRQRYAVSNGRRTQLELVAVLAMLLATGLPEQRLLETVLGLRRKRPECRRPLFQRGLMADLSLVDQEFAAP
ncbi:hypothetical protein [Streptomyces sp. NPDC001601]|uniref:hypothetical protein n=1 Tax=Streptomyces sp. NPDC001601 TaxID=3364592 RepID=UPI0036D04CF6